MKEQVDPFALAESQILRKGPRVLCKVLLGAELGGIDKNRDHDAPLPAGDSTGATDERGMPFVKGSHGGNKNNGGVDSLGLFTPVGNWADPCGRFHQASFWNSYLSGVAGDFCASGAVTDGDGAFMSCFWIVVGPVNTFT